MIFGFKYLIFNYDVINTTTSLQLSLTQSNDITKTVSTGKQISPVWIMQNFIVDNVIVLSNTNQVYVGTYIAHIILGDMYVANVQRSMSEM